MEDIELALCRNLPINWFFDDYESDAVLAEQIDECCLSCPIMVECMKLGQAGRPGVYGGIYWSGSKDQVDESRNAHKTADTWDRIRQRIATDQTDT